LFQPIILDVSLSGRRFGTGIFSRQRLTGSCYWFYSHQQVTDVTLGSSLSYWMLIRGPFEKFVDWRQCAAAMQKEAKQQNSGALPRVH